MKWFDKWLAKKCKQAWENKDQIEEAAWLTNNHKMAIGKANMGTMAVPQTLGHRLESNGIRFHLYKATGGFVVETQSYDKRTDRHQTQLYVFNNDQEIGQEIGKIITLESLRS